MSVRDRSDAARQYAQAQHLGAEAINYAVEIKVRAEREMGLILKKTPLHPGGRPAGETPTHVGRGFAEPMRLAELGIAYKSSARMQALAELPEEAFERHISEAKDA